MAPVPDESRPKGLSRRRPRTLATAPRELAASACRETPSPGNSPTSPTSPVCQTPKTSYSHLTSWRDPAESLIIFDWDDTLCPTTFIWEHPALHWEEQAPFFSSPSPPDEASEDSWLREGFTQHAKTTAALLRLAASLGQVVIVTLAKAPWVETSINNFLPDLQGLLEELHIRVVYAREAMQARYIRMANSEEEVHNVGQMLKQNAMRRVVKAFYRARRDGKGVRRSWQERSWKNILSVGDSAEERLALQDTVFRHRQVDRQGRGKECRCKVVKLLDQPTLEVLTAELEAVISWLQRLVLHDGDMDLDFENFAQESLSPLLSPTAPSHWRKTCGDASEPPTPLSPGVC